MKDEAEKAIAEFVYEFAKLAINPMHKFGDKHRWDNFTKREELEMERTTEGLKFHNKNDRWGGDKKKNGYIHIKCITPIDVKKSKYGKPILKGVNKQDVQSTTVRNESYKVSVSRDYETSFEESTSVDEDFGTEITTHITQTISYGGEASVVSGETEFGLEVAAHYNKAVGKSTSEGRNITTSIEVPPRTECTITTERSLSKFEQEMEFWCGLDFQIEVYSYKNYHFTFDSISELKDALLRRAPTNWGGDKGKVANYWNRECKIWWNDTKWIVGALDKIDVYYKTTARFDKATSGNVVVTDRGLDE